MHAPQARLRARRALFLRNPWNPWNPQPARSKRALGPSEGTGGFSGAGPSACTDANTDASGVVCVCVCVQDRVGFNPIAIGKLIMRSTQQFSITLPLQMADVVKAKVAAGEYATESEVIRDGLRALLARDRALESWLVGQVAPAYDALKANPSRALSADQVRARLAEEHLATSQS